ncbi:MAG: heme-binding protein [Proteobacteria bacterium]|nr:heme-binding protein [Pseudomonadota bacterium]
MRSSLFLSTLTALWLAVIALPAAEPADGANPKSKSKDDKTPAGASAGDSPDTARKRLVVAPGLKVDLWAAEPLIENVVNFSFDEQGRAYVVETGRRRTSVFDIRSYRDWVDADLSFRTPWERAEFLKQNVSQDNATFMRQMSTSKTGGFTDFNQDGRLDWRDLEVESERIKLVWDSTGSGIADKSAVFADGFNTSISGVAAGVLARRGEVFFTCIPDVWRFQSSEFGVSSLGSSPGEAFGKHNPKLRTPNSKLATGFGVHIAYGGHDMHGLKFGPDGKLYWSIADRGSALTNLSRTLNPDLDYLLKFLPDSGAVFRSNPDGSDLEVVAIGLRNPQELVFDDYGNLFTGDNNADGGDKARWVHVVEGADYGWRYGWQHLPKLGAWNSEMLWGLAPSNTALSYPPPVSHIGHGPAGITHYPGTGLPESFRDCFFLTDFPGGVRYFRLEPSGASFKVANAGKWLENNSPDEREGKLLWNLYPTDIEFGPDGGAYVLDWVAGWEKTGKGRIWRVHDPAVDRSAEVRETKGLLATIAEVTKPEKLAELLAHPNQRVREEALHTLCAQGHRTLLVQVAKSRAGKLALIGAAWGLSRSTTNRLADTGNLESALNELAQNRDADIRATAAKAMRHPQLAYPYRLELMLHDTNLLVRANAAESLGWLKHRKAIPKLIDLLKRNSDQDATVRHAAVYALVRIGDTNALLAAAHDHSASVRLGVCLALRRLMLPEIAQFLDDSDPRIVLEAARAIADIPIEPALPKLAALLDPSRRRREESLTKSPDTNANTPDSNQRLLTSSPTEAFLLRRALNANIRLGQATNALALAAFAARSDAPAALRVEALEMLADWPQPSGRDKITGLWRPLTPRDAKPAADALRPAVTALLTANGPGVPAAALAAIEKLTLTDLAPKLLELVKNAVAPAEVRAAALRTLGNSAFRTPHAALFDAALKLALADPSEALRKEASRLSAAGGGADALARLAITLQSGTIGERQSALQSLASLKGKEADDAIRKSLNQLLEGKLPKELHLDLLDAAAKRTSPSIKEKLGQFEAKRDAKDHLARWRECLTGGDAKAGRVLFYERQEAACARCHKVAGEGGDVGPDLAGLVAKKGREYALESIVLPNRVIAPGFESLLVVMKNGQSFAGLVKSETGEELTLNSPEDGLLKLKKADITKRTPALSPMPETLVEVLTKREIRDLVEFLATAK